MQPGALCVGAGPGPPRYRALTNPAVAPASGELRRSLLSPVLDECRRRLALLVDGAHSPARPARGHRTRPAVRLTQDRRRAIRRAVCAPPYAVGRRACFTVVGAYGASLHAVHLSAATRARLRAFEAPAAGPAA